jgi:3-dehydroquinate synthase
MQVHVFQFGANRVQLVIGRGVIDQIGCLLKEAGVITSIIILTDDRVGPIWAGGVRNSLESAGVGFREITVPAGEPSKSLAQAQRIYGEFAAHSIGRDATILALGGGMVSDLGGFVAGTWMRGLRWTVCPTTLEADVDACLGGKTAVNVPGGKNLVGLFHQPFLIAVDPACLTTLEPRDLRAGLAESVKHAILSGEDSLAWLESHAERILSLDDDALEELIARNLCFKAGLVAQDVEDRTGARAALNLGHTIGHAVEEAAEFTQRHGECVALGLRAAMRLSKEMGVLDDHGLQGRVEDLLDRLGLPARIPRDVGTEDVLDALRRDKKAEGGEARFVLLRRAGEPVRGVAAQEAMIRRAVEALKSS